MGRPTVRGNGRRSVAAALTGVVVLALGGCSGGDPDDGPGAADPTEGPEVPGAGGPTVAVPPDLARTFRGLLARRAEALLGGDRAAYTATLARDAGFRAEQTVYFDNLQQLPLAELSYRIDGRDVVRAGDDYWVVVEVTSRLEGYDAAAVTTPDRFRFSPARADGERLVLSSVTDPAWETQHEVVPQPWDVGPVEVREGAGVLGVFDTGSVAQAPALLRTVELGIAEVAAEVPYEWPRSVVLYALSDDAFVRALEQPTADVTDRHDGLAFPVPTEPGGGEVASVRFALHPRMLDRSGTARARLVRHELAHVAIGEHDDAAPLWLSEGLAEYVSVRPLAPEDRLVPTAALRAARADRLTDLPDDAAFTGTDDEVAYALSWWACEHLALVLGEQGLWALLDELAREGDDAARRLEGLTGLDQRGLARRAARLMLTTFDPDRAAPTDDPTVDGPSGAGTSGAAPTDEE